MHRLIVSGSVAACLLVIGCSVGTHSEFRQTQARFSPRPGRSPRVYLYLAEVPDLPLRSVGVIWVSVPARHGIKGVAEAAADRGRRVGCWALVERSIFSRLRSRQAGARGIRGMAILVQEIRPQSRSKVILPPPTDRSVITAEFECVIPDRSPPELARAPVRHHR